jgi:hypothetical protein
MKKLLLTLLIILSSLVSFSQEYVIGRAYQFHFGRIINDHIQWVKEYTPVDILIQFNEYEVIIYSENHQVYQIEGKMGEKDDTEMWSAIDKKGDNCWLFITLLDDSNIAVTIRYRDYAWMYICGGQ